MSLASTVITAIGYRLTGGITINSSSDPPLAACLQWLNETALWITGLCAENNSDLGRTIGSFSTAAVDITAVSKTNPCQVTIPSHGLMTSGTREVVIKSAGGMSEINDTEFTATYVDANNVTIGVDSTSYTTYTSGGYVAKRKYSNLAANLYTPAQIGWLVKDNARHQLQLASEKSLLGYDPVEATEPSEFYVDGENNICFPSYPDDTYVVKIPYYSIPAITAASEMPFLGLMDNVFIEAVTIRAQNRDEYDTTFELKWQSFLLDRVRTAIAMRKKTTYSVGL